MIYINFSQALSHLIPSQQSSGWKRSDCKRGASLSMAKKRAAHAIAYKLALLMLCHYDSH